MDYGFVFQLGEIVTHKAMLRRVPHHDPQRLFITSRLLEECSGGVQRYYQVTAISLGYTSEQGFTTPIKLTEIELAPYPSEPSPA